MQVITNEKLLAAVSGGDMIDDMDFGSIYGGGAAEPAATSCTAASYSSDMAPLNAASNLADAQAQSAALVAAAQPSVVGSLAVGVQSAATGCAAAVSATSTVAKLAGVTGAGQVGNLVICSAGALGTAILKK